MLEHIPLEGLWSDFSNFTPLEECISAVEQIFRKWKKPPIISEKMKFSYCQKDYRIVYYPLNDTPVADVYDSLIYINTIAQSIQEMFSVKTDLIIVYPKKQISESEFRNMFSIVATALELSGIRIPTFLQKEKTDFISLSGVCFNKHERISYSSRTENFLPDNFKSFSKIRKTFELSLNDKIKSITASSRFLSNLNEMDFKNGTYYQRKNFYTNKGQDPVKMIHVCLQFDPKPIDKISINILNPDHVSITPVLVDVSKKVRESELRDFVALVHEIWTYHSIKSAMTIIEIDDIAPLMDRIMKTMPVKFKTAIKGASPLSSFANLCEEIVYRGTVEEMALLWNEYLQRVKDAYDKKKPIPGIETDGVDFNQSIVYQKLQMINYCIVNPDAGYIAGGLQDDASAMFLLDGTEMVIPERQAMPMKTADQHQKEDKIFNDAKKRGDAATISFLQNRQMKSDMSAFKEANPTAIFADFVRWRIPHDYDQEKNEVKATINPEYPKLWEKASPVSARQQEEFFNPDKEIELALIDLEMLKPGDLIQVVIPVLFEIALYDLMVNVPHIPFVDNKVAYAERALLSFSRRTGNGVKTMMEYAEYCSEPIEALEDASFNVSAAESLLVKFPGCTQSISLMLEDGTAAILPSERPALEEFFKKTEFRGRQSATIRAREYVIVAETEKSVKQRLFYSERTEKSIIASSTSEPI